MCIIIQIHCISLFLLLFDWIYYIIISMQYQVSNRRNSSPTLEGGVFLLEKDKNDSEWIYKLTDNRICLPGACLKNAFCKMYVTICGRFCLNEGGVAGYVNWMKAKSHAKWGVKIAGMIFQTRSKGAAGVLCQPPDTFVKGGWCWWLHTVIYLLL